MIEQILIFKLEFDRNISKLNIRPIDRPINIPIPNREYGAFEIKSGTGTGKVEAFADDTNVIGKLNRDSIDSIKNNLAQFGTLSGLKCNVDKSAILVTGTNVIPDYVADSGFKPVNKINILGLEISNNLQSLTDNFDKPIEKIRNISNFWRKFRLSLPGRICVAKTLLLSQLTYPGSVLNPTEEQIRTIDNLISDYIVSGLKINRTQVTVCVNKGGLGMINAKSFLQGLQCSWIKRCSGGIIDNWRSNLLTVCGGKFDTLSKKDILPDSSPIIHNIVGSFETFKEKFFEHNENFMSAKIFGNPSLINSYRDRSRFNTDLFPRFINDNSNLVIRDVLTLNSTSARPVLISKPELEILTGTNIPVDLYNNFKIAIRDSFKCLKKIKIEQNFGAER
jgi:hypothetical protein